MGHLETLHHWAIVQRRGGPTSHSVALPYLSGAAQTSDGSASATACSSGSCWSPVRCPSSKSACWDWWGRRWHTRFVPNDCPLTITGSMCLPNLAAADSFGRATGQLKQQSPASFPTSPCCMQGVLDAKGRNSLSRVNFYVFIPSLTFSKLAASVDLSNLGRWWFLPANIFIRCHPSWLCACTLLPGNAPASQHGPRCAVSSN